MPDIRPDYPACLAGYCRISGFLLSDNRISGRIIRHCRISGPTLILIIIYMYIYIIIGENMYWFLCKPSSSIKWYIIIVYFRVIYIFDHYYMKIYDNDRTYLHRCFFYKGTMKIAISTDFFCMISMKLQFWNWKDLTVQF